MRKEIIPGMGWDKYMYNERDDTTQWNGTKSIIREMIPGMGWDKYILREMIR